MKPEIIVCGLGRSGYKIFCLLRQQGAAVVGVSDRPLPGERGEDIIIGDVQSGAILIHAGLKTAHTLVLASNDDALNLAILTQAKIINPQIRIINRLYNEALGDRLDHTLTDHVTMSVSSLAAPIFAFAGLGNQAIGQLRLYGRTWPIHQEVIHENHPWLGRKLSELWDDPTRMLIYYLPAQGETDLVSAVVNDIPLNIGDHLIVGIQPAIRSKGSSNLRKFLKAIVNIRSWQRHARPVALITLALLIVILIATFTYVCVNLNTSIVDAFYFSVGMITGAGGQEDVAEQAPDSIKIFTAIMMIIGAGVIGICYALINDFILGSRIREFWDAATVPTRNHYVVCGLGGIGMQIVRQLISQGNEVVVIESDPHNRFLHTAMSLGVPIIREDATLVNTLNTANIKKAEALLAVTSNDMINVEIGLTSKSISAKIPTIIRCQEPQFAQSIKEVFEFESVLSPIDLAAPSFAAAALGGKILGNGMTEDLLWVALATMITPRHPFCGKIVKNAAMQSDFVPLYLERSGHTIHGWNLLEISLHPGDVLYLTMPANKLDQLWRVPPSELVFS
jgi:Trk K+ transport system NAD-binding subunit